jgi:aspartate/methionine/tyrosine aminotransferase
LNSPPTYFSARGGAISKRAGAFDSSGIRKVFDLAAKLQDPINLSIGQPDFEMPPAAREAAKAAIDAGRNGYTPTQGIPALRERLEAEARRETGQADRRLCVTSGSSGALVLALIRSRRRRVDRVDHASPQSQRPPRGDPCAHALPGCVLALG